MKKAADAVLDSCEILSSEQMRALETAAITSGQVTGLALMERAGAAVTGQIRLRWPVPRRACVLCGPGNNGGDGYVIARLLHRAGWRVRVLGVDNAPPPDAARMRSLWQDIGPITPLRHDALTLAADEIVVDAIFGTGLRRAPDGEILAVLHALGRREPDANPLIAVDGPSGLDLDTGRMLGWPRDNPDAAPHAQLTVTFDSPRLGHVLEHGSQLCGKLVVADIGLAPWRGTAFKTPLAMVAGPGFCRRVDGSGDSLARRLLTKPANAHKFDHGHVLVIAGGSGHGGAARLAARAALRVGAGLVTIAPPQLAMAEHAGPPDALMRRAVDGPRDLAVLLEDPRISTVLIGPGCGVDRAAMLLPVVLDSGRKAVIDADGLTALAQGGALNRLSAHHVLTPHLGEFARLFPDLAQRLAGPGQGDPGQAAAAPSRVAILLAACSRMGATVLLKGPDTVIAQAQGRMRIQASSYDAAAPWLGTAGSGDVLAGLIAGLLARGFAPEHGAQVGAALHAAAGRLLGAGLIADDLVEAIPQVLDRVVLTHQGRQAAD